MVWWGYKLAPTRQVSAKFGIFAELFLLDCTETLFNLATEFLRPIFLVACKCTCIFRHRVYSPNIHWRVIYGCICVQCASSLFSGNRSSLTSKISKRGVGGSIEFHLYRATLSTALKSATPRTKSSQYTLW